MRHPRRRILSYKIKIGLTVFFLLTLLSYFLIFILYVKDFPENIKFFFSPTVIFFIILLFIFTNLFNILRVLFLCKIFSKEVNFMDAYMFTLGGVLFALITPFQSGGLPFQIYLLSRKKIKPGKSVSIIFVRGVQSILVLFLTLPFIMIYLKNVVQSNYVKNLLKYFLTLYMIIIPIFLLLIFFNEKIKNFLDQKFKESKFKKFFMYIVNFFSNFLSGIKDIFSIGFKENLISLFFTFLSLYSYAALSFFIIKFIGGNGDFFTSFSLQFLLIYLTAFVPTPGSSGVAEGGMAIFFNNIVGKEHLIIYILIFRIFSTYIPAFLGLFSFLKIKEWKTIFPQNID